MEEWKDWIGREMKIIFNDGENHISKKEGTLIGFNQTHLFIKTLLKQEGILIANIIRFEVQHEKGV